MLKQVGTDIKVMQELLRHSSVRCTLDTYTQAIMPAKRAAQYTSHLGNSGDADWLSTATHLYILRFLRLVYSRVESQTPAQELA